MAVAVAVGLCAVVIVPVCAVRLCACGQRAECHGFAELAAALVVAPLRQRQAAVAAGARHFGVFDQPGEAAAAVIYQRRQQIHHIHAARGAGQALAGLRGEVPLAVALPGGNGNDIVADAAARKGRQLHRTGAGGDPQHIAELDAQALGGGQADFGPALPGYGGDGIGNLLQQRQRRARAIAQQRVGEGEQGEIAAAREVGLNGGDVGAVEAQRCGARAFVNSAALQGGAPVCAGPLLLQPGEEIAAGQLRLGLLAQGAANAEQRIAQVPRVVQRAQRGLHQPAQAGARADIAPGFQGRGGGQHQIGQGGGLIGGAGEAHQHSHPRKGGFEAQRLGQGVSGVGIVHQQQVHAPLLHGLHQLQQRLEAGPAAGAALGDGDLHARADGADDLVQQQHGGVGVYGAAAGDGCAGGQRHRRPGLGQGAAEPGDVCRRNAAGLGRRRHPRRGQRAVQQAEAQSAARAALNGDPGQGQGQHALAAGADGQPLVAAGGGEREPRAGIDQPRAAPRLGRNVAGRRPLPLVLHRRGAGVEHLRAEIQHQVGRFDVEEGLAADAEDALAGGQQHLAAERLVDGAPAQAGGLCEAVQQAAGRIAGIAPQQMGAGGVAAQRLGHLRQRLVPADGAQRAAGGIPLHGAVEAVRREAALNGGLGPGAEPPLVDRMLRVALQLDGAALPRLHMQAAAHGALGAGGGVDDGVARRDLLGLHHIGNQLLHMVGAAGGGSGASAGAGQLEEIAAVEFGHLGFRLSVSNGR